MGFQQPCAGLTLYGHAGIVGYFLAQPGERVEQAGFSCVGITGNGNSQRLAGPLKLPELWCCFVTTNSDHEWPGQLVSEEYRDLLGIDAPQRQVVTAHANLQRITKRSTADH